MLNLFSIYFHHRFVAYNNQIQPDLGHEMPGNYAHLLISLQSTHPFRQIYFYHTSFRSTLVSVFYSED